MDKLSLLEKKIKETIEYINRLKEENRALQNELSQKNSEIEQFKEDKKNYNKIINDYRKVKDIQIAVKNKLTALLEKIDRYRL
jgi:hypothetical protein